MYCGQKSANVNNLSCGKQRLKKKELNVINDNDDQ